MNLHKALLVLAAVAALAEGAGCGRAPEAQQKERPAAPAKVENAGVREADLATITLTAKAEGRLGIQTAAAEYGPATRSETLAGEVIIPPGQSLLVTAPVAGTIGMADRIAPAPGTQVGEGQPLFRRLPLLPVQRDLRVTAEAELASARTRLEAARAREARARQMLKDGVGSTRAFEDARQELDLASTAEKTAAEKLDQLNRAPLDSDIPMTIVSPLAGILRTVHAGPGQQVAAGATLAEVIRTDPVWIRVPVYTGRLAAYLPGASARVTPLGGDHDGGRVARSVTAPPSADPLSATTDLYFELSNADLSLRPGEKVSTTLPLRGRQQVLKVPAAAILYDMHGGTWLYENTAPQTFVRRRVEVAEMQGSIAVLRAGPAPGARVVTAGAAELFGTEFGAGK